MTLLFISSKFWTRNRPGDHMRDRYNLNTLPFGMSDDMADMAGKDINQTIKCTQYWNVHTV